MKASLVVIAVTACSTSPASSVPPPPWTSGTQLRAQLYTADDGFETLAGRHDLATDLVCYFDPGTATFFACPFPIDPMYVRFSDASCSQVVFRYHPSPRYLQYNTHDYEVAEMTLPMIYRLDRGQCISDINDAPALVPVREVPPMEMRPEQLVHVSNRYDYNAVQSADGFSVITALTAPTTTAPESASTRLRNIYETHGPLRRLTGIYDSAVDRPCSPTATSQIVCAINSEVSCSQTYYTEATCTTPAIVGSLYPGLCASDRILRCAASSQQLFDLEQLHSGTKTCVPVAAAMPCDDTGLAPAVLTETID